MASSGWRAGGNERHLRCGPCGCCLVPSEGLRFRRSLMPYRFDTDPVRSRTMSRIRSCDTAPEVTLRKVLWSRGVRYRKNYARLPGAPDIAIVRRRVAVFVDGEFWHGFDWEGKRGRIKSNPEYWIPKIERTIARDRYVDQQLADLGWKVLRFWASEVRRDPESCADAIVATFDA